MVFSICYIIMQAKKKLKRQDFLFESGWFQDLIRKPGELHMQQFQISDCEESTIGLFDAAACVYVDDCKYSIIFVGACEASVFVRDCEHTIVICATQQFRVRDCRNCHFMLFCQSQPVIESSYDITIDNFPLWSYRQQMEQMRLAKINVWNNNWYDVFDFTPKKFNRQNHRLQHLSDQKYKDVKKKVQNLMAKAQVEEIGAIFPRVLGSRDNDIDSCGVFVAYPVPPPIASEEFQLLHSRVHQITAEQLDRLGVKDIIFEGRTKVLFIKVLRNTMPRWQKVLKNIVHYVVDKQMLQLYEGVVFAPFKDDH